MWTYCRYSVQVQWRIMDWVGKYLVPVAICYLIRPSHLADVIFDAILHRSAEAMPHFDTTWIERLSISQQMSYVNCTSYIRNYSLLPNLFIASTGTSNSSTSGSQGSGQGAGGCPPFDVSTCDMTCVSMDSSGCLSCKCPATTGKFMENHLKVYFPSI